MNLEDEKKKALVDYGPNPAAPKAPDVGIAIALDGPAPARFGAGAGIPLSGSYKADEALLKQCDRNPATSILLTLIRTDKVFGTTVRLVTPNNSVQIPEPPAGRPADDSYREGGQFQMDLQRYFKLPAEPAKYTIEAVLGPHFSKRLAFEVGPG